MNVPPTLYHGSNYVQRRDANDIFGSHLKLLRWKNDGTDTILDIGSGSGDVTVEFILPSIPTNFKKLIGIDICDKMVRYATQRHASSKVRFEQWDMRSDTTSVLRRHPEGFDHIVSSYTLHWAENQKHVIRNIYDLLTPNGDCLLIVLAKHSIFDVYDVLVQSPRWQPYMRMVPNLFGHFVHKNNPEELMKTYLKAAGFSEYHVQTNDRVYIYDSLEMIKRNVMAVNPYVQYIPPEEKEDHLKDYIKAIFALGVGKHTSDDRYEFHSNYKLMIVHATK